MDSQESRYKLMQLVASNPQWNQRELARALGISLGKTNYCLQALLDKGFVKAGNFRTSPQKSAYLYKLTASGIQELVHAGAAFWVRKRAEYELLSEQLEQLASESNEVRPS